MAIKYTCFSKLGSGKAHNEDAVLLNGQVHQGRVRVSGAVDESLPCYFAVAEGVSSGTLPSTASRSLLELLQNSLSTAPANASLSALLHLVQQDYVALSANTALYGMASTLVGVRLIGDAATIFKVGDSRAQGHQGVADQRQQFSTPNQVWVWLRKCYKKTGIFNLALIRCLAQFDSNDQELNELDASQKFQQALPQYRDAELVPTAPHRVTIHP